METGQSRTRLHVTLGLGLQPRSGATVELGDMLELSEVSAGVFVIICVDEASELLTAKLVLVLIETSLSCIIDVAVEVVEGEISAEDEEADASETLEAVARRDGVTSEVVVTLSLLVGSTGDMIVMLANAEMRLSVMVPNERLTSELMVTLDSDGVEVVSAEVNDSL